MNTPKHMNTLMKWKVLCERDGRMEEFYAEREKAIEELRAKGDTKFGVEGRAEWLAMRHMGGVDKDKVTGEYNEYVQETEEAEVLLDAHVMACEIVDALGKVPNLPSTAAPALELEWVGGHPAMLRYDLQPYNKNVKVTAKDILEAPHGPPPSRRAVSRLVNFVNRPHKFHEMLLQEDKKANYVGDDTQEKHEEEHDLSLKELRALLSSLVKNE